MTEGEGDGVAVDGTNEGPVGELEAVFPEMAEGAPGGDPTGQAGGETPPAETDPAGEAPEVDTAPDAQVPTDADGKPEDGTEKSQPLGDTELEKAFPELKELKDLQGAEDAKAEEAPAEAALPEGVDERWSDVYKKDPEFATEANRKVEAYDNLVSAAGDAEDLEMVAANKKTLQESYKVATEMTEALLEFRYRYSKGDIGGAMQMFGKLGVDNEVMTDYYLKRSLAKADEAEKPGSLAAFEKAHAVPEEDLNLYRRTREQERELVIARHRGGASEEQDLRKTLREDPYVREYNKRTGAAKGDLREVVKAIDRHGGEGASAMDAFKAWRGEAKRLFGDLEKSAPDPGVAEQAAQAAKAVEAAQAAAALAAKAPASSPILAQAQSAVQSAKAAARAALAAVKAAQEARPASLRPPSSGAGGVGSPAEGLKKKIFTHDDAVRNFQKEFAGTKFAS